MSGFTTSVTLKEMINKFPMRKRRRNVKKRKRKRVARDKQTDLPKKYLSGLKGGARSERASLIKAMSEAYKKGQRIPRSMFRARARSGY